ncbi:unnamed protein product [Boreogadus saida]
MPTLMSMKKELAHGRGVELSSTWKLIMGRFQRVQREAGGRDGIANSSIRHRFGETTEQVLCDASWSTERRRLQTGRRRDRQEAALRLHALLAMSDEPSLRASERMDTRTTADRTPLGLYVSSTV